MTLRYLARSIYVAIKAGELASDRTVRTLLYPSGRIKVRLEDVAEWLKRAA